MTILSHSELTEIEERANASRNYTDEDGNKYVAGNIRYYEVTKLLASHRELERRLKVAEAKLSDIRSGTIDMCDDNVDPNSWNGGVVEMCNEALAELRKGRE